MLAPGSPVPALSPAGLDGGNLSLAAVAGPALLAFFKVSCPTCQFTFPYLERIAGSASGLSIAGISQDSATASGDFARAFGLTFPIYLDESKAGYPASNAFRITHVPSLFLVEDGRISEAVSGFSRVDLENIARRFGAAPLFGPGEKVPDFRPG